MSISLWTALAVGAGAFAAQPLPQPTSSPASSSAATPSAAEDLYNVVVILMDDLGIDQLSIYDDVNQYDCPYPYAFTPNLASLAANGVRFTQARAAPICSPTRAQIHSSRYGRHTGAGSNITTVSTSNTFREFNVDPARTQLTLPQALPAAYQHALIGKVHLHLLREPWEGFPLPSTSGATGDTYATSYDPASLGGGLGYDAWEGTARNANGRPDPPSHPSDTTNLWRHFGFTYYNWIRSGGANPGRTLIEGCGLAATAPLDTAVTLPPFLPVGCDPLSLYEGQYVTRTERLALESWISTTESPFFALWAMNDVHRPPQWPPVLVPFQSEGHHFGPAQPSTSHFNTRLRAKLETADSSIGLMLRRLNDLDLLGNTVVIVVGDNGTQGGEELIVKNDEVAYPPGHPLYPYTSPCPQPIGGPEYSTAPYDLTHFKGSVYENGVRVPLIVWGPPAFFGSAGTGWTSDALVDVVDVYETVLQIAMGAGYTAPTACGSSAPNDCRDGIGFLRVVQGLDDASTHARQDSYNAVFAPNSWPPVPDLNSSPREYYIRRDGTNLWKIVRHYQPAGCFVDEFYELTTDPLEANDLGTSAPAYAATAAAFQQRFPPLLGLTGCP